MTAAPPRPDVSPLLPADRAAPGAQQRRLRYGVVLAGLRARGAVSRAGSIPRLQLCGAADLLTALGVRVDVVQPASPWPRDRAHRLVVEDGAGLLGDLALLVGVPRSTRGWADVADRVLPVRPSPQVAGSTDGAVDCAVTLTYRSVDGLLPEAPRTLTDVVSLRGLVVEVRLHAAQVGSRHAT